MARATATGIPPGLPDIGVLDSQSTGTGNISITPGYSDAAGAWTELIAATSAETHWLEFTLTGFGVSTSNQTGFADIGIGAAAAEVAVVSNWAVGGGSGPAFVRLPVRIPAGSRISFRYSTPHATLPAAVLVRLVAFTARSGDTRRSPSSLTALGVTATNTGTVINSNDTWVEITAATTQPFQGIIHAVKSNDGAISGTFVTHSLGVGAAGAETAIVTEVLLGGTSETWTASLGANIVDIPAGTRIAGKSVDGSSNIFQFAPLAIPYT